MNLKTWVPMGAAIILGLVAAKLGKDMISHRPGAEKAAAPKFSSVVVAKEAVGVGAQLKDTDLAVMQFPLDGAPQGSFDSISKLVGRVISQPLVKQQPVTETTLAAKGTAPGLTAIVPDGQRTITIEVNETSGVAGMLLPGCRVDIVTVLAGDAGGPAVAKTIARNILIIAVGRKYNTVTANVDLEGPPAHSVTLQATPKQAEVIELICRFGNPRLVLRGSHDEETDEDTEGTTLTELRGAFGVKGWAPGQSPTTQPAVATVAGATTQPAAKAERPYREVQFIKGGVAQTMKIEVDGPQAQGAQPQQPHGQTPRSPKAPVVDVQPDLAPVPGTER